MAKNYRSLKLWKLSDKDRSTVNREFFYFLSVALVVFIGLEIICPNIVLAYFNLNILLTLWLADGLFIIFKKTN